MYLQMVLMYVAPRYKLLTQVLQTKRIHSNEHSCCEVFAHTVCSIDRKSNFDSEAH